MALTARRPWCLVLALAVAAALPAQAPPGVAPPADASVLDTVPVAGSPAQVRWQAGIDALQKGDRDGAVPHLLAALQFHPDSPPVLLDLWRAVGEPAQKALWLERFVRAQSDALGHLKLDAAQKKALGTEDTRALQKLAEVRAQAAAELAKALDKLKATGKDTLGNGVTARFLCETFVELAGDAPPLLQKHGPAFATALAKYAPDWPGIVQALLEVVQRGAAAQKDGKTDAAAAAAQLELAQRAARILQGLLRQATFGKDLQGTPPPDLQAIATAAAAALPPDPAVVAKVWTIAELEAMDAAQRDEFTLAHRSWLTPGIALSPTGKYRVETICGFETLLGTATTCELHHARLVAHFGGDPFAQRQGTIRIVPEVNDLETEGAPFWWAGGFQGGDRTVLHFQWGSISGLGHGLTHELTHRFDGATHPFLGAWYGEGHASWTAAHYARTTDADCTEDWLDRGTVASSAGLGYGNKDKFVQLLTGKVEDYRDNYPVGYSLYAFLRGYPPKQPPRYRTALQRYEQNARGGGKDPVAYFTATFCDGKDGRPRDLDGFVAEWQAFLDGCARWGDPKLRDASNAWVGQYGELGPGDPEALTRMAQDEPTWTWARDRAEPFFGQSHAAAAGDVLLAAGMPAPATAAWLASLQCDGWSAHAAFAAATQLQALSRVDAAASLRSLARARFPAQAPPPSLSPLFAQLPRTKAYLDAVQAQAAALQQAHAEIAAASLLAEHERLATRMQLPLAAAAPDRALPPPPVPRALGGFGWVEDALTGYDKNRAVNCWYATPEGDLHVGREKPKETTGALDRAAHARLCFVRSADWLAAGDYVVKMRVHFTTAFVSGAIVFGHWRRDRDVRLTFSAGDFAYAVGRSEQNDRFTNVQINLHGLWARDGQLPQMAPGAPCKLVQPAAFDLELRVRGPSVLVVVDGEPQFRYTTHDGAPIEGFVGFAMNQGAIRVQQPTVQRRDVAEAGQALTAVEAIGLDLAVQPTADRNGLLHLRTRGIPTGPVGTLVLWLPPKKADAAADAEPGYDLTRFLPVLAKLLKDTVEFPQPWYLAAPKTTPQAELDAVQAQLKDFRPAPLAVLPHAVGAPLTGDPWILFVDAQGILRAAAEVGEPSLFSKVQRWARLFRAR